MRRKTAAADRNGLSKRVYIPFAQNELHRIDEWSFARHIRNRSQAVRTLVFKALASERSADQPR
jgi:metal-responsive CopG/Arc/MetJ family transcriptional regulator